MRVVETGDHGALLQVDHLGGAAAMEHRLGVVADGKELAVLDRHGGGGGVVAVHGVETAVVQDQVGGHGTSWVACGRKAGGVGEGQGGPQDSAAPSTELVVRKWRRSLLGGSWLMACSWQRGGIGQRGRRRERPPDRIGAAGNVRDERAVFPNDASSCKRNLLVVDSK